MAKNPRGFLMFWLACGSVLVTGGFFAYLTCRSTFRSASPAELRVFAPPELLVLPQVDEKAVARYGRFVSICQLLVTPESLASRTGVYDRKDLSRYQKPAIERNRQLISAATAVLESGPIQRPVDLKPFALDKDLALIKGFAKALVAQAEDAAASGDQKAGESAILENLSFATRVRGMHGNVTFSLVSSAIDNLADKGALTGARKGQLSPPAMREVIRAISRLGPTDPLQGESLGIEFQQSLAVVSQIVKGGKAETGAGGTPGNFDAIETVRLLGNLDLAARTNALSDWRHQNVASAQIVADAKQGLPREMLEYSDGWHYFDIDDSGPESNSDFPNPNFWDVLVYRFKMNRIPNSVGRQIFGHASDGIKTNSVAEATRHELVRAVLALRLYAAEHASKLPDALDELVSKGYLDAVPMDWFACAPLRYDAKRRMVYSLGPSCVDHGGAFENEMRDDANADFGAFIDQPKPISREPSTSAAKGSE